MVLRHLLFKTIATLGIPLFFSCRPQSTLFSESNKSPHAASASVQERKTLQTHYSLIVWLTIDQLRPDYITRAQHQITQGGFRRLLREGKSFNQANYSHAITETAPGHASLFTGRPPSEHGIIANSWLFSDAQEHPSVFDPSTLLLFPSGAPTNSTQKPKLATRTAGRSPAALKVKTIGDILKTASPESKVVSVSFKDRAAILPAGRQGKAYFISPGGYSTTSFYHPSTPEFLKELQEQKPIESFCQQAWHRLPSTESKLNPQKVMKTIRLCSPDLNDWYAGLNASPFADDATLALAKAALEAHQLGEDTATDLLAISLSATDKIGHRYGPSSPEAKDNFLRVDQHLSSFLQYLEARVGKDRLLVILSADHGALDQVSTLQTKGVDGQVLLESEVARAAYDHLRNSPHSEYEVKVFSPYVYLLPPEMPDRHDLTPQWRQAQHEPSQEWLQLNRELATSLSELTKVQQAYPCLNDSDLMQLPSTIQQSVSLGRSGSIYIVPTKNTHFFQHPSLKATHGSPYQYDTHVPLVISGREIKSGSSNQAVNPTQIAPTVAALLHLEFSKDLKPLPFD